MNRICLLFVGLTFLFASTLASAQSRSTGRNSGGSGSSFGSGGSGGGGSGSSSFDISSGFGSQSFGDTSSFGQSSGMSALSSGRTGSAAGMGRSSSSSDSGSRTRTNASGGVNRTGVRSNTGTNRNSVAGMGGSRSPGRAGMSGLGGGMAGLGQFGGMNGMGGMGGRRGLSNRGVGVQQSVRPMIVVRMDRAPTLAPMVISQAATNAFAQARNFSGLNQVQVNVDDGGIATLRGTTVTDHDRTIAAAMLAMEPGVRRVENQMVVAPPSATLPPIARPTPPPSP